MEKYLGYENLHLNYFSQCDEFDEQLHYLEIEDITSYISEIKECVISIDKVTFDYENNIKDMDYDTIIDNERLLDSLSHYDIRNGIDFMVDKAEDRIVVFLYGMEKKELLELKLVNSVGNELKVGNKVYELMQKNKEFYLKFNDVAKLDRYNHLSKTVVDIKNESLIGYVVKIDDKYVKQSMDGINLVNYDKYNITYFKDENNANRIADLLNVDDRHTEVIKDSIMPRIIYQDFEKRDLSLDSIKDIDIGLHSIVLNCHNQIKSLDYNIDKKDFKQLLKEANEKAEEYNKTLDVNKVNRDLER